MSEKNLEQKLDEALKLFDYVKKQADDTANLIQTLRAVCEEMQSNMDGQFAVMDSSLEKKLGKCDEISKKMNKRVDDELDKRLEDQHKRDLKQEENLFALKACLINLFEFLPGVRNPAPSQEERNALKAQIDKLGL